MLRRRQISDDKISFRLINSNNRSMTIKNAKTITDAEQIHYCNVYDEKSNTELGY